MVPSEPVEVELKLHADPADLERLGDHVRRLGVAGVPRTERLVTTYFDTPDRRLAESGVALRVRRVGRRRVQAVKARARAAAGATSGAAMRAEWEWPIASDRPNLALLGEVGTAVRLPAKQLKTIRPIFVSEIERTRIALDAGAGVRLEVALDRGALAAGTARLPISEIELELLSRHGPAGTRRLYEVALELLGTAALRIGTQSKADLGYAMLSGGVPAPHKAAPLALEAAASAAETFRRIARSCVAHLLDNQDCVLAGSHPEGVHQMRVAIRRLRASLALFREMLDPASVAPVKEELRWLAGELSPARDWDVFMLETLKELPKRDRAARLVRRHAAAPRQAALAQAQSAIATPRYTRLVLTLGAWIEGDAWRRRNAEAAAGAEQPIGLLAPALLARRARHVAKAGKHIARLSVEARHHLRKSLKALRYGTSFLAPLYPRRRTEGYLAGIVGLQERLGALNDWAVALRLLSGMIEPGDPTLSAALATLELALAKRLEKGLRPMREAWHAFAAAPAFWE